MPIRKAFHRRLAQRARHFLRSRRGNIAALSALLLVPLVTLLGVATQTGSWYLMQRAMQNAADSAVIAAATNGGNGGTDYATEAKAIAANYGFTDGAGNVHVTAPAPATYAGTGICATTSCFEVKITNVAPLYLLQLIGYTGNATTSSGRGQSVIAGAMATVKTIQQPFCLLALGSSGASIQTNGSPAANLGCNVQSNGDSNCNGHSITTGYSDSVGTQTGSKDCGTGSNDSQPSLTDPYATATMSTNITNAIAAATAAGKNNCTGSPNTYYPEGNSNRPAANTLGANMTLPAVTVYCGDVNLTNNVVLTSSAGTAGSVIIIQNGMLNLNGNTLQSASGSGVALIFYSPQGSAEAYTSGGTPTNFICIRAGCANGGSGGVLDLSSPRSGTFSGITILQDKNLPLQGPTNCTGNDKWAYAGSSPTWNISGVVDLDRTNFCVSGAINQATNGLDCLTLVDNMTIINGTGNLLYTNPQSQCPQQGVTQIYANAYVIGQLVY